MTTQTKQRVVVEFQGQLGKRIAAGVVEYRSGEWTAVREPTGALYEWPASWVREVPPAPATISAGRAAAAAEYEADLYKAKRDARVGRRMRKALVR